MPEILSIIIGNALKFSYLIPFIVFYIFSRRCERIIKKNFNSKLIFIGSLFVLINILYINYYTFKAVLEPTFITSISISESYNIQIIANILLLISYLFLFLGVVFLKRGLKGNTLKTFGFNIALVSVFIVMIISIFSKDFLSVLLFTTYPIAILFLSYSFIIIASLLNDLKEKTYWLAGLAPFIILLDPTIYIYIYNNILLVELPTGKLVLFFQYRVYLYLISAISIILISIPTLNFFRKILSRIDLEISEKDLAVQKVIKRYIQQYENFIGAVTKTVFSLAANKYQENYKKKIDYTERFDIKNLNEKELQNFFEILVKKFDEVTGPVSNGVLKKIRTKENKEIIERIYKY